MLARTEVLIHDHSTVGEVFLFIAVIRFVVVFVPHILFANILKHFYTQKIPGCPPTTKGQNERVRPYFFLGFLGTTYAYSIKCWTGCVMQGHTTRRRHKFNPGVGASTFSRDIYTKEGKRLAVPVFMVTGKGTPYPSLKRNFKRKQGKCISLSNCVEPLPVPKTKQ